MSRSIFLEISSLTPQRVTEIMEDVRLQHRGGTDKVFNLVLTNIADEQGNLYTDTLNTLRPYMVGGALQACDNVFVGTRWLPWSWSKYGADPNQWYNHYAVWGGILNSNYRWDNINYNRKVWAAFKAQYNLPWQHFYISMEMDLGALYHSALGPQIKAAYEAYLIQVCRDAKAVEPNRSVLWSPFHWDKFSATTSAQRNTMKVRLNTMMANVKNLSGMGINFLDLQDGLGARPGTITTGDAISAFKAVEDAYAFASTKMNVEWYRTTSGGFVAHNAASREAEYLASGITTGAVWEGRYWEDAHSHTTTPPIPSTPAITFMTREQWGANNSLPRLGFYVPPSVRTELHVHHTVSLDLNDATPNRWSVAEATRYMRALQTARPDLGRDIPYTYVFFLMENLDVLICEGRGLLRTGAHTAGHNTAGFGWSVAGNFDIPDNDAANALLFAIVNEAKYLRLNGYPNLCSRKNPRGWDLWGHRDTAPKSCPGNTLYPKLGSVKVV